MCVALPPELMVEILCRLPVKVLLQIRCVSKLWRRLIDSSYFIQTHLNRSSIKARKSQFLLLSDYSSEEVLKSVDLDFVEPTVDLQNPLEPNTSPGTQRCRIYRPRLRNLPESRQIIVAQWRHGEEEVKVWGSCNGLVLISNSSSTCLWNPSTRKHRNLPELDLTGSSPPVRPRDFFCGFGYDSSSDDYKVIKFVKCKMWQEDRNLHQVWIYSIQSHSWTQSSPLSMMIAREPGVLVHEALHWPVLKPNHEKVSILAFDLKTHEYRMIPLPKCQNAQFYSRLGVLNGSSLCLIYSYMPVGYEIWVMMEQEEYSWTRVTLQRGDLISYPGGFISAALRDGKELLLHRYFAMGSWIFCKPNSQEEAPFKIFREIGGRNWDVCLVSLVSPYGGTASAQPNEALKSELITTRKNQVEHRRKQARLENGEAEQRWITHIGGML